MKGFTLIETLAAVSIIAIISLAIGDSALSFFRANDVAGGQANTLTAAQGAFDVMTRDLRKTNYAADGRAPITSIAPNAITFFADSADSGNSDELTFSLSGTTLLESNTAPAGNPPLYGTIATPALLASGVQNIPQQVSLFRYFDSAGNEIFDFSRTADVASVLITLLVNPDTNRVSTSTFQSTVTLRNLKK